MKPLREIKGMRNVASVFTRRHSSMPHSQHYQKHYLDLYVLAQEKSRMEQELNMLEEKKKEIINRLSELKAKMSECKKNVNLVCGTDTGNMHHEWDFALNIRETSLEY